MPGKKMILAGIVMLAVLAGVFISLRQNPAVWKPGKPLSRDTISIGVLYIDRAEGSGYSAAHEAGIRRMLAATGLADSQVLRKFDIHDADHLQSEHAMRQCIAAGANIIIATSWGYMDTCEKLAEEFPGVVFAHASGYKSNGTNFTNYFGRIYQPRYLSGVAAGMKTKTGKIGYVAAMGPENSEVTGGINAFALGVESVRPEARIHVFVTNSWYDPANERQAAERLIAEGCDVISQHCNTPEPQKKAQASGVWSIGYNMDMSSEAPNAVLASVVWNWGAYYTHLINSLLDGSFTTTPYLGGMREGMVDITFPDNGPAGPEIRDAVAQARQRIIDEDFAVFRGVMTTNDGKTVGQPDRALSDSEIISDMDWYYHTIGNVSGARTAGAQ